MEGDLLNKKGRVIVRNLVFTLSEKHIRKLFQPFGEILEVNMPINNTNNQNKGFAFVQFKTRAEALKAISELNGTTFKGRVIAVDLSVPKSLYKEYEKDEKRKKSEDKEEVEEKLKEEAQVKEDTQEKPEAPKEKKKKKNAFSEKTTLFVRNISFDTTEDEFKDYFSTYGEINYAKLCMNPETKMHKGTGFVQYKNEPDAQRMLEFSKQAEAYYDQQKSKKKFIAGESELLDELELNGRRLIVVPAVRREDVEKAREESNAKKKKMMDKKNTHLLKEGLTNVKDFANTAVSEADLNKRQKYADAKEENMKKNPNYRVSLTRLRVRNLPKHEFTPEKLKELFRRTLEEYVKAKPLEEQKKLKKAKLIIQSKVMYEDGTSKEGEGKKSKGLGYIEMASNEVALYCVKALNNFPVGKKRLIIDFALEDQRKIFKREKKRESFLKKQKEGATENKKKKKIKEKDAKKEKVADINDVEKLKKLLEKTKGRGRKQRIKKKLVALGAMQPPPKPEVKKEVKGTEEANVVSIAGKRRAEDHENKLIEKEIMKSQKQKKRKKRDERRVAEDQFEEYLSKYKKKILEKLEEDDEGNDAMQLQ